MDGHFARDQIYGLFINFLTKSERPNSARDLILEGEHQPREIKEKEIKKG